MKWSPGRGPCRASGCASRARRSWNASSRNASIPIANSAISRPPSCEPISRRLRSGPGATIAQHPPLARRRALWLSIGAAAVIAAAVAWAIYGRRPATLTDKDTIVLADFTNTTGDPVFDDTLRQGLAVQLQQSPFLSLVSDDRIRRTLALMQQPPEQADSRDRAGRVPSNAERRRARWIDRQPRQSVHPRSAREELLQRRDPRRRAVAGGAKGGCPRLAE